ncbi:hypothetical protein [Myxacorys almedinensis]|uniref:Uncharacterized protein n=1 Tax=Myxacorys almedinensis A TaxID=2690445 RepID=A0A8J7Z2L1_9CYAN|nr:hypothetical protein [Myxacorys almedinensis]NDJ16988.1 hypothetical protein [Myxacorys almedinensis A]
MQFLKHFTIKAIVLSTIGLIGAEVATTHVAQAQVATSNQTSAIGSNSTFNQIVQSNPQVQVPVNASTSVSIPIQPLQLPNAYVNTENDFGMNLSVGANTLDASNVTVSFGIIYQPGRSADHRARMARLRTETEVLEANKKTIEANLALLQTQVQEATLRLQKLKDLP